MAETTGISWCHATLNFWVGCTKVSTGEQGACEFCYAETWAKRWPAYRDTWGVGAARKLFQHLRSKALKLERLAVDQLAAGGGPFFCFSNSLSDIFDNEVPIEWLTEAFAIMRTAPNVTFLLLTKRGPNILKRTEQAGGLPPNAGLGITIVTQPEADRDLPHLLMAAAALSPALVLVSMEPLMGPVDLTRVSTVRFRGAEVLNALTGELSGMFGDPCATRLPHIDWVITGGESGTHARPTHPDWFRALRDQCVTAGVPYHHKQNGEWLAQGPHNRDMMIGPGAKVSHPTLELARVQAKSGHGGQTVMAKVGKKASGRLLDGVLHDAMPVLS